MDVPGAALATAIAMFVSWFFSIAYIKKKYPELEFTILPHRVDFGILKEVISVGLPLGLNNSLYSIGHIIIQSLINAQGSTFIAACTVGGKINGLANVAITSFSSAATTYAGQNLGAKNYKRLKNGGLRIPLFSGIVTAIAGITMTCFCRPVLALFTNDEAVLTLAVQYVRVVLPFTWCYAIFNGIISFVNGLGEVRFPTIVNILMFWAVRIPCGFIIANYFDGTYIMASFPISFVFGMLAMLSYYLFSKRWKEIIRLAQ